MASSEGNCRTEARFRASKIASVLPDESASAAAPASSRRTARTDSGCRAGPGEASGWYCTENTGRSLSAMPQFEPSNSETWVSTAFAGRRRAVDREAVVHRGDLDLAGGEVLHRMVGAVVALVHLHGLRADRDAEHLVAEADAEGRHAAVDQACGSPAPHIRRWRPDRRGRWRGRRRRA